MYTLAIELATEHGSLALAHHQEILAEISWTAGRRASTQIFKAIETVTESHLEGDVSALSLIVIGRGPGSYSGLRVAMAVAHGLALPGQTECFTMPTWAVAASQAARNCKAQNVTVIGDARRERFWVTQYAQDHQATSTFTLVPQEALQDHLTDSEIVISTDTVATAHLAKTEIPHTIAPPPKASTLLEEALKRREAGIPSEPLTPIYIHPPVFEKPRFPPNS
jgi:tRNA threonylcarbamoyladenosine biosynthesis protein TsaB